MIVDATAGLTTEIAIGDLLYLSSGEVFPASALTDLGSEVRNQAAFARVFAGIANAAKRATTDPAGYAVRVYADGVFRLPCDSTTFSVGDLVGACNNSGGTALENQKVKKLSAGQYHLAIGEVVKAGSSLTRVWVRIRTPVWHQRFGDIGSVGQGLSRTTTTASAAITLTVASTPVQSINPGGADRDVNLPAITAGLVFYILHDGTANTLAVKNPAGSTLVTLSAGQRCKAVCDSTGWFVIS